MGFNEKLWKRREQAVPRGVGSMHPVFVAKATNDVLLDVEGQSYIDFASGIAVTNTGHSHPVLVDAVQAQLDDFSHVCFQVTPYESYIRLAEELNELAPGPSKKKTIFLSTGAEAVENAVKIARAHTKKKAIISFGGGFHGRTMMALALTGKMVPYKTGFGPYPGEIFHIPYPSDLLGVSEEDSLNALAQLFKADLDPGDVAALIIEPIQGEGGFYVASNEFLKKLREICDAHGFLMIADEIQSGFARTGKMFAINYSGVEPDILTVAKAMAGGIPIAGVIGKADIMDGPAAGGLGGTYGGSPLGCAGGLAVLEIIKKENLCQRALKIGETLSARLARHLDVDAGIGEVRGKGAMLAVEFVDPAKPHEPDPDRTKKLVGLAREEGLIILSCGVRGNVLRFLPALTIADAQLEKAMDILDKIFIETRSK